MDDGSPGVGREPQGVGAATFDALLSVAIGRRGLSLRELQQRLEEQGFHIGTSTLSMWRTGARGPERESSIEAIRELEQILQVERGHLTDALASPRRVGPDRHRPFATVFELPPSDFTAEPTPELFERSGAVRVFVDQDSRIRRTVNRTLWQGRRDGARDAVIFYGSIFPDVAPPQVRGTLGCDLVDVSIDPELELLRATLRLHAPLRQGELVLTERESLRPTEMIPEYAITTVAPRRQAEIIVHIAFDPSHPPRRCWALVEAEGRSRTYSLVPRASSVMHAEFDFGPGMITIQWEW
ncbi:hypothetical protein [Microbacterium sp. SA39]|uniref:hypothetical protein n=1 Tax=Microbacterium sp. SA39 TaxID=1263625 RepID=UPI0005F9FCEC|nr:hypothetical protein [Microbacterium sp. SA39]KJQ52796.1 hypothetical protein RS85_03690 [Microbacterium sp. SA39]